MLFKPDYTLGLCVSLFDEHDTVIDNLNLWGAVLSHIEIVQSDLTPHPELQQIIDAHPSANYTLFPNLDTRTAEEKANNSERFDIGARSMARNFSAGFQGMKKVDYVICITGDTKIYHLMGVDRIIHNLRHAEVGVARAIGQDFHKAEWTREEMADKNNPKGGRHQDMSVKDFMPQFFIVKCGMIEQLSNIKVTNPWCFEQCLGDAIGDAVEYIFSPTAYGFNDGIVYNVPSPTNWKHKQ